MKISLEKANELLKKLGVTAEVVADDKADKDADIETVYDETMAALKEAHRVELKDGIIKEGESAYHAKSINTLRTVIQRELNIPKREMDEMNVEDIVKHVKANMDSRTKSEAGDWEKKYNTYLQESEAEKEASEAAWQNKYDNDLKAANQKYLDYHIGNVYFEHVNKMPRSGGDAAKQAKVLRNLVKSEGYEEIYDEATGAFTLKKGGKSVKVDEELRNLAKDILPLAKDTKHINPREVSKGNQQGAEPGVAEVQGQGFGDMSGISAWADNAA